MKLLAAEHLFGHVVTFYGIVWYRLARSEARVSRRPFFNLGCSLHLLATSHLSVSALDIYA
jgi:hypothetical protein